MFRARRFLEASVGGEEALRHIVYVLTHMGVSVKTVAGDVIRAEHGSYNAFHPRNIKKAINVHLRSLNGGRVLVDIEVDYTGYMIYVIVAILLASLVGLILVWQAMESLEYLEDLKLNPFIVLVRDTPPLLSLLDRVFGSLREIEVALTIILWEGVALILAGIASIIYLVTAPHYANSFADELASNVYARLKLLERGTGGSGQSVPSGQRERVEGRWAASVTCSRRASNVIACSIIGVESLDAVRRILEFMGFSIAETSSSVLVGEKEGSMLASEFISKKMRVRAILVGDSRVEVVFETSMWSGFSEKNAREAEEMLYRIVE